MQACKPRVGRGWAQFKCYCFNRLLAQVTIFFVYEVMSLVYNLRFNLLVYCFGYKHFGIVFCRTGYAPSL